jgi:hypothetical protein
MPGSPVKGSTLGNYNEQAAAAGNRGRGAPPLAVSNDAAEQKTPIDAFPTLVRSTEKNVLSTLRSYTYNFTIAGLSRAQAGEPSLYVNQKTLDRIILKSAGKTSEMTSGDTTTGSDTAAAKTLIDNFNLYSAGKFNMFIENVEIDSVMSFTQESNATTPTIMKFDVIEPYSVNGFLEALAAAAAAGGWNNYAEAVFVLLIEFQGYPDSSQMTDPITLKEKRYLPFHFTKMDIDITERGTKYVCEAVPSNEMGLGNAGILKNPMSVKGDKVGILLQNLVDALNIQLTEEKETGDVKKGDPRAKKHDIYKIRFDGWDSTTGFSKGTGNDIETSDILDPDKHARNFSFQDPQTTPDKKNQNYRGATPTIQYDEMGNVISSSQTPVNQTLYEANNAAVNELKFDADTNLYDVISNVIANSEYVRKIMKDLYETKGEKSFTDKKSGMVKYFLVKIESEENTALGRDDIRNMPLKIYTYVISPYQIHFTRIPDFSKIGINQADLETKSIRSYDYIYTGQNQEILSFKLQYNYLFYEGMPQSKGSSDSPTQTNTTRPNDGTQPIISGSSATPTQNATNSGKIEPSSKTDTKPNSGSTNKTLDGILRQDDPYFALANNLHQAVIDPKASMVTAEMEILGDPFFLVTGGLGNQIEKPNATQQQTTESGQANHLIGDCIIDIKFKNPQDIGTNGFIVYNQILNQPFQGAYRIIKVQNFFKEGLFKQRMELVRVPGQDPQNRNTGNILNNSPFEGTSNPDGQTSNDTRNTADVSLAPSGASLPAVSGRGVPGPNSNFTGAAGGFGQLNPAQSFGGFSNGLGKLTAASAIFGGAIPGGTDQSSPIRLNPASLINGSIESVNNTIASAQATVAAVQNFNINSVLPSYINNPTIQLSGLLGGGILSKAEQQLRAAESTVAANIDLAQSAKDGVSFKYVTDVANVPPVQGTAKVVSEYPALSVDEQAIVAKGGLAALAEARGVAVSELPTNIVKEANSVISLGQSAASEIKAIIGRADAIINQGKAVVASANPLINIVSKSG